MYVGILQYMVMMMGAFAVLAWFGSLIDNLLLTYLIGQYACCIYHFTTKQGSRAAVCFKKCHGHAWETLQVLVVGYDPPVEFGAKALVWDQRDELLQKRKHFYATFTIKAVSIVNYLK